VIPQPLILQHLTEATSQRFACPPASGAVPRKKLVRREDGDYSQALRLAFQLAFLALNVWIGAQFYLWVRWAESGGQGLAISRPAGVEGWLPIEGLMQLKYVLSSGRLPSIHVAGFFLFSAFLLLSWLLRKSFCSWLCPVGTLSEYLWKLGHFIFRRNFGLPRWLDLPLRSLKYVLLAFFGYAVAMMSAAAIAGFVASPYGLIVDVRMLNFFRYLGGTAALVILGLLVASILVQNIWCRYLCPYGAFLGLAALLSPTGIVRSEAACIACGKCAKACPSALPVDKLVQIRSAECTGCLECVAVCPAKDALAMQLKPPLRRAGRRVPGWTFAAGVAVIFVGLVGYAKISGHWDTHLPRQVYLRLVPLANEQQHPLP
jgi:polyferredoxin